MNILFVSAEAAPFAKTGGLGDVAAAVPKQLHALGHDVRLFLPLYPRAVIPGRVFTEVISEIAIELAGVRIRVSIHTTEMPGTRLPVYFVHCPALYDRPSIYGSAPDEHLRWAVLSWAALASCQRLGFAPDIAHINDWQTGLLPLILKTHFAWDKLFARTRTLLTIHNLGHQGTFESRILPETGLANAAHLFHQDELREGRLGYLLTGILHANAITTVSPTYAREIQTPSQGVRLDPMLRSRKDVLFGILNGIDEDEWNPETDKLLPHRFSIEDLDGKEHCKAALLASGHLPYHHDVPVVALVSRLVWQKGIDLCMRVLPRLLGQERFQLVVLGTGEPQYEVFFRRLERSFPRKVAYQNLFSEDAAHYVEAGADIFLMPSRYEPCGLNQMYSLRYGTPPIVHKTGGLADTVWQFHARTGHGTGFVFENFDERALTWAIKRALEVWGTGNGADRARWRTLQRNGMGLPFGWRHRIGQYVELYKKLVPDAV